MSNKDILEGKKVHGILFKGEMVRAILEGRKTMTRRLIKPQPDSEGNWKLSRCMDTTGDRSEIGKLRWSLMANEYSIERQIEKAVREPYAIGDLLYVKETYAYVDFAGQDNGYVFRATDPDWETMEEWKWKPSIFMPKKASRIWLEVTDVKCERVCDISEEDAKAEGARERNDDPIYPKDFSLCPSCGGDLVHGAIIGGGMTEVDCGTCVTYKQRFRILWENINGEETWNHWCFAYSFRRIDTPTTN